MHEEDVIAFSTVKSSDIIAAALDPLKTKRMKFAYNRSLGLSYHYMNIQAFKKEQKNRYIEEKATKEMAKQKLSQFLDQNDSKSYNMELMNKTIEKYMSKELVTDIHTRMKVWKMLGRVDKNMRMYPKYYATLTRTWDGAFKEYSHIVDLDVRRTTAANDSPVIYASLTRVLLAYAKYDVNAD